MGTATEIAAGGHVHSSETGEAGTGEVERVGTAIHSLGPCLLPQTLDHSHHPPGFTCLGPKRTKPTLSDPWVRDPMGCSALAKPKGPPGTANPARREGFQVAISLCRHSSP